MAELARVELERPLRARRDRPHANDHGPMPDVAEVVAGSGAARRGRHAITAGGQTLARRAPVVLRRRLGPVRPALLADDVRARAYAQRVVPALVRHDRVRLGIVARVEDAVAI